MEGRDRKNLNAKTAQISFYCTFSILHINIMCVIYNNHLAMSLFQSYCHTHIFMSLFLNSLIILVGKILGGNCTHPPTTPTPLPVRTVMYFMVHTHTSIKTIAHTSSHIHAPTWNYFSQHSDNLQFVLSSNHIYEWSLICYWTSYNFFMILVYI